MNRRPIINRGDLVLGMARASGVPREFLADFLGYELTGAQQPPPSDELPRPTRQTHDPAPEFTTASPPAPPPAARPTDDTGLRHWMAVRAESYESDAPRDHWLHTSAPLTAPELDGTGAPPPPKPPLIPWSRLWPYLRSALGARREGRRLDERRLVRGSASLRPPRRLPRLRYVTWAENACIIVDRRDALTPFWDDAEELVRHVCRLRGREGLTGWWLEDGRPSQPARPFGSRVSKPIVPPPGAPVLVVGDLGQLGGDPELAAEWVAFGRQLRSAGNPRRALQLCPRHRWKPELISLWASAVWDAGQRLPRGLGAGLRVLRPENADQPKEKQGVDDLLTLLALAVRVEPGLLRAIRLLLGAEGADLGTEFEVWRNADARRNSLAMALLPEVAVRRRENLKRSQGQPTPPRRKHLAEVAKLLAEFHAGHGALLRARETKNLAECGLTLPAADVETAEQTYRRAAATQLQQLRGRDTGAARQLGVQDWVWREIPRVSPAGRGELAVAAVWTVGMLWQRELLGGPLSLPLPEGLKSGDVADIETLAAEPGQETIWEVRLVGSTLRLRQWLPPQPGTPAPRFVYGSPAGWLPARRRTLGLRVTDRDGKEQLFRLDPQPAEDLEFPIRLDLARRVEFASDCADLELLAMPKPVWASRFGRDQGGIYAEFTVAKVIFRLRWIPPGGFFMGSQETEAGRRKNEQRHWVTLTRGFWLGETLCTQAQWEAVMHKNPSQFKGAQRPVEKVSWEDCREFCRRLRTRVPGLEFRLPTEAEWEYACRAGTDTAFGNGSQCTVLKGKDPALEPLGWHGEGINGETHPVREKSANGWGLYDMHGNVWEWCADQCDYGAEGVVTDTYVDGIADPRCNDGAFRVVRGGSAWNLAGDCRSAFRLGLEPGYRDSDLGFRLAAGQPASGESGAPGGADGRRDDDQAAATGRGAGVRRVRRPKVELIRPAWATRADEDQFGRFAEFGVKGVVFQLRWIPPGRFLMGSPLEETGRFNDEGPQHSVILTRGFWLGATPCTQAQWKAVMGKNPSHFKGDQRPVDSVNWNECEEFCARMRRAVPGLPARLPTEAEWEFACRAGTASGFNDGTNCTLPAGKDPALDKLGWYDENSGKETHSVGGKLPNRWGLYDMHGNVLEWCADGLRNYSPQEQVDPLGPMDSADRVVRGGSYWGNARDCRSAYRSGIEPGDRSIVLGFRLAAGQPVPGGSGAPGGSVGRRDDDQAEPTRRGAGGKKQGTESRKKKGVLGRLGDLFK